MFFCSSVKILCIFCLMFLGSQKLFSFEMIVTEECMSVCVFQISNDLLPSLAEGLGGGHTLATFIVPSQSHTLQSDMGGQPPWAINRNNFILSTSSTRKQLCCMNYSWPGPLPGGLVTSGTCCLPHRCLPVFEAKATFWALRNIILFWEHFGQYVP